MQQLHIAFQDGFDGDTVIAHVNGNEVFDETGVSTRTQLGIAAAVDVTVDRPRAEVEIAVPSRGLSGRCEVDMSGPAFLGVSVENGELTYRFSDERFRYA